MMKTEFGDEKTRSCALHCSTCFTSSLVAAQRRQAKTLEKHFWWVTDLIWCGDCRRDGKRH